MVTRWCGYLNLYEIALYLAVMLAIDPTSCCIYWPKISIRFQQDAIHYRACYDCDYCEFVKQILSELNFVIQHSTSETHSVDLKIYLAIMVQDYHQN